MASLNCLLCGHEGGEREGRRERREGGGDSGRFIALSCSAGPAMVNIGGLLSRPGTAWKRSL